MAVFELKLEVSLAAAVAIEELLAEREEQRLMVLEDKPAARAWITGYFEARDEALEAWSALRADAGTIELPASEPEVRELPDADWKNSYKAHFKAWKFGKLNWVPVWEKETFALPAGEAVLWLDPGMAFGTGNHETTRLVVERMVSIAGQTGTAGRVIDAGCGSGILALSAVLLGYRDVAAFDNDAEAVRVSEENAVLNDLAGRVEFYVGDLVTGLAGRQAELVLANIQADVLMRFVNELCASVAPRGSLVLSGILSQELERVREVFAAVAAGWRVESRVMGEWADLTLTRSS
ncbi:50S ribosomal protein L11 methyltransferase [Oleiharenicola lentus]|uniref:50S ribosomal protein L11 methyltransferase n=1 Tax=Oleiharenicola lentus TaxID=2508720 RepID=UPI003F66E41C